MVRMQTIRRAILAADLCWIVVAMGGSYLLRYGWAWEGLRENGLFSSVSLLFAALGLWFLLSSRLKLDGFQGGWYYPAIFSQLFLAISGLMLALLATAYLSRDYVSRQVFTCFGILLLLGFIVIRLCVRMHFRSLHEAGAVRRVVIVGSGSLARELATKVERHPEMLCQVVGFLCPADFASDQPLLKTTAVSARTMCVVDVMRPYKVDEIIIALPKPGHPEVLDLVERCRNQGIAVSFVPHPYELYLSRAQLLDLDGLPLLQLQEATALRESSWRRVSDVVLSGVLLVLSAPIALVAAGLLKAKKGQAFCREMRCGRNGILFWMHRLNSQRSRADLPHYELILQHLSITELPQLWDVLRGEMSLVGPRPEPPEKVKHYSDWQRQRLNVKPGITGLAQVHGLRDEHSSEDKTRFDLQYMLGRSFFIDASLILQTSWTLITRLVQLPRAKFRDGAPGTHATFSFEENLQRAHSTQSSAD
jgi:lipopolysaccharide/colanic/teichoic acid biosynthesis glycosyltransferase